MKAKWGCQHDASTHTLRGCTFSSPVNGSQAAAASYYRWQSTGTSSLPLPQVTGRGEGRGLGGCACTAPRSCMHACYFGMNHFPCIIISELSELPDHAIGKRVRFRKTTPSTVRLYPPPLPLHAVQAAAAGGVCRPKRAPPLQPGAKREAGVSPAAFAAPAPVPALSTTVARDPHLLLLRLFFSLDHPIERTVLTAASVNIPAPASAQTCEPRQMGAEREGA